MDLSIRTVVANLRNTKGKNDRTSGSIYYKCCIDYNIVDIAT